MRVLMPMAIVSLLLGCTGDSHVVAVDLRTDLVPGVEFDSVRTVVEAGEGSGTFVERIATVDMDFVTGVRIAELEVAAGTFRIRVEALAADGAIVASRPVTITLDGPLGVTVVLGRQCQDVTCPVPDGDPNATACLGGTCVDPACTVENPTACGEPECATAADCPSSPVGCATEECAGTVCLYRPDGAICSMGEYCDPDVGCRAPGGPALPDSVYLEYLEVTLPARGLLTAAAGELFGDVRFTRTGPSTYDTIIRFIELTGGVPNEEGATLAGPTTIEPDGRWLFEPTGAETVVYSLDIVGSRWTFTVDETDPRSGAMFARVSVLEERSAPSDELTGRWGLVSWSDGGTPRAAGDCVPDGRGGAGRVDVEFTFDARLFSRQDETSFVYADPACMTGESDDSFNGVGIATADGAGHGMVLFWDSSVGRGAHIEFDYVLGTDDSLALTPTTCMPGDCGSFVPLTLGRL